MEANRTLLVVEDNEINRDGYAAILIAGGRHWSACGPGRRPT